MPLRTIRWPLVIAVLLAGVVMVLLGLPWALSQWLTRQLPLQLAQALGRPVSLAVAEVGLWPPRVVLQDLRIGPAAPSAGAGAGSAVQGVVTPPRQNPAPGGDPDLLTLTRAEAVLATGASLRHRALVLQALSLTEPRVALARTGPGRTSIDDLVARLQQPRPAAEPSEPPAWAIYNLQVTGGEWLLDDRVARRQHRIDSVNLGLPFLSALAADVAVQVQPSLALRYDGRPLRAEGRTLPFSAARTSDLTLQLDGLDLAPLAAYVPASVPVQLRQGRLDLRLRAEFNQAVAPQPTRLVLSGELASHDTELTDRQGQALARWQQLQVPIETLQPLARQVALGDVRWQGLQVPLTRYRDGQWSVQRLAQPSTPPQAPQAVQAPATVPPAGVAPAATPEGAAATAPPGGAAWQAKVKSFALSGGQISLDDQQVRPAAAWQADELSLTTGALAWPLTTPAQMAASTTLRSAGRAVGQLNAQADADLNQAQLRLQAQDLVLATAQPYLASVLKARLAGTATAQLQADWSGADGRLSLLVQQLALDQLSLGGPGLPSARLAGLHLNDSRVDLARRSVALGQLRLDRPQLQASRAADGRWDVLGWLADPAPPAGRGADPVMAAAPSHADHPTGKPASAQAGKPGTTPAPWRLSLGELWLQGGQLQLTDAAVPDGATEPLRLNLSELRLRAQALAWPGSPAQTPSPVSLDTRLAHGGGPAQARLRWRGQIRPSPLAATGQLQAERLPVHLVDRYARDAMGHLALVRAEASLDTRLTVLDTPGGWRVNSQGQLSLGDWQLHLRPEAGGRLDTSSELMSWQTLRLDDLALALAPGAPPQVTLRQATLDDFYSRLLISETGSFNLTDRRGQVATVAESPPTAGASAPSPQAASNAPTADQALGSSAAPTSASASAAPATAAASAPAPVQLYIGGVLLRNGRVDFTDRFIRPNYSARLTMLNGELGRFRSGSPEMATLALTGRAADTAVLDIRGQINPAAQPLALDIRARATDLELPPLSPYAGKYAGYAIERGKLSMDVAYKISPSGALEAQNQVILNQLTFGEQVASPEATKLPVLLAVALLKDRNGVIDLNLPVSGSLDDPQFSISGLIFKVIGNLLSRALTAPFSLLAGSGGPDLSQVAAEPGLARLEPEAGAALDKLAQALKDRETLNLTITGMADPVSEREAYRAQALEARLVAEHRRTQGGTGATPAPTAEQRARVLRDLYRQSPLPDRPRNAIGLLRDLPGPEMAQRLKAAIVVSNDTMRELALQRALAVRDALAARGVPTERLFLAAPQVRVPAEGEPTTWQPQVQLSLALR